MKRLSILSATLSGAMICGATVVAGGAVAVLTALPVQAAEVCYEDDRGRIVNRRRPGYLRVECPQPEAENPADRVEGSTARAAGEEKDDMFDYGLVRSKNKPSNVPCVSSGRSESSWASMSSRFTVRIVERRSAPSD